MPFSAKAAARRPGSMSISQDGLADGEEQDARAQQLMMIEDLKAQLRKAEFASQEYQKQATILQARLGEANRGQTRLEERLQQNDERLETLEIERRDATRRQRELEIIYERGQAVATREKEMAALREEELQETIRRMKETLTQKPMFRAGSDDDGRTSRSGTVQTTPIPQHTADSHYSGSIRSSLSSNPDNAHFAPAASLSRSDSRNNSKLIFQKDKVIESLRLEMAEAQIKLVELENLGGGHMQEIERKLMEAKINNARLMEENESFQMLLQEKTLNGDLVKSEMMSRDTTSSRSSTIEEPASSSLAEELSDANETDERLRKLEIENNSLKEQNKALTLYINKIVDRLLANDKFEHFFQAESESPFNTPQGARTVNVSIDNHHHPALPPSSVPKDTPPSLLQRAKSVVGPSLNPPRPTQPTTAHDPSVPTIPEPQHYTIGVPPTAPSIPPIPSARITSTNRLMVPLESSHRRTTSEIPNAAHVVGNMYRTPLMPSSASANPGLANSRSGFFSSFSGSSAAKSITAPATVSDVRNPSDHSSVETTISNSSNPRNIPVLSRSTSSGSDTATLDGTTDVESSTSTSAAPSPPRSMAGSSGSGGGAIMTGNRVRPLRLVREKDEVEMAAKRSSWMGWFNRTKSVD